MFDPHVDLLNSYLEAFVSIDLLQGFAVYSYTFLELLPLFCVFGIFAVFVSLVKLILSLF